MNRRCGRMLGSDAVHQAEQSALARIEGKEVEGLSVSTDFEVGGRPKVYPWSENEVNE